MIAPPASDGLWSRVASSLEPVPSVDAMTSREIVRRAIEFGTPPRIPYSFVEPARGDFFELAMLDSVLPAQSREAGGFGKRVGESYRDEWGVGKRVTGYAWDQVIDHPLQDPAAVANYRLPDVAAPQRFDWLGPFIASAGAVGKYVVAGDPVLLYERLEALVGFEQMLKMPCTAPDALVALLDGLAELTVEVIARFARIGGVDGFMTWQDLASQTGPHLDLRSFRRYFKPRYERIVAAAHDAGMHFIWHSCGRVNDLIAEMVDIGVDVVQLDQPRLSGYRETAQRFGGQICFWNTLDVQWSTRPGLGAREVGDEVAAMVAAFRGERGGLMVRQYPLPADIGLSREFLDLSARAFHANGCTVGRR